jgi:hypothetical protein
LIDAYDGSLAATNNLTSASVAYGNAMGTLIGQIETVRKAIGDMFGETIRSLTLTTLDKAGQYAYLQNEAETLRTQLLGSANPDTIRALAEKINADINAAFGLLEPEQQKAALGDFVANINDLNAAVNERLSNIETDVQQSVADVLNEIRGAIADAAMKMGTAADTQVDAANTNLAAANTPVTVNVVVTNPATSEIGGGG